MAGWADYIGNGNTVAARGRTQAGLSVRDSQRALVEARKRMVGERPNYARAREQLALADLAVAEAQGIKEQVEAEKHLDAAQDRMRIAQERWEVLSNAEEAALELVQQSRFAHRAGKPKTLRLLGMAGRALLRRYTGYDARHHPHSFDHSPHFHPVLRHIGGFAEHTGGAEALRDLFADPYLADRRSTSLGRRAFGSSDTSGWTRKHITAAGKRAQTHQRKTTSAQNQADKQKTQQDARRAKQDEKRKEREANEAARNAKWEGRRAILKADRDEREKKRAEAAVVRRKERQDAQTEIANRRAQAQAARTQKAAMRAGIHPSQQVMAPDLPGSVDPVAGVATTAATAQADAPAGVGADGTSSAPPQMAPRPNLAAQRSVGGVGVLKAIEALTAAIQDNMAVDEKRHNALISALEWRLSGPTKPAAAEPAPATPTIPVPEPEDEGPDEPDEPEAPAPPKRKRSRRPTPPPTLSSDMDEGLAKARQRAIREEQDRAARDLAEKFFAPPKAEPSPKPKVAKVAEQVEPDLQEASSAGVEATTDASAALPVVEPTPVPDGDVSHEVNGQFFARGRHDLGSGKSRVFHTLNGRRVPSKTWHQSWNEAHAAQREADVVKPARTRRKKPAQALRVPDMVMRGPVLSAEELKGDNSAPTISDSVRRAADSDREGLRADPVGAAERAAEASEQTARLRRRRAQSGNTTAPKVEPIAIAGDPAPAPPAAPAPAVEPIAPAAAPKAEKPTSLSPGPSALVPLVNESSGSDLASPSGGVAVAVQGVHALLTEIRALHMDFRAAAESERAWRERQDTLESKRHDEEIALLAELRGERNTPHLNRSEGGGGGGPGGGAGGSLLGDLFRRAELGVAGAVGAVFAGTWRRLRSAFSRGRSARPGAAGEPGPHLSGEAAPHTAAEPHLSSRPGAAAAAAGERPGMLAKASGLRSLANRMRQLARMRGGRTVLATAGILTFSALSSLAESLMNHESGLDESGSGETDEGDDDGLSIVPDRPGAPKPQIPTEPATTAAAPEVASTPAPEVTPAVKPEVATPAAPEVSPPSSAFEAPPASSAASAAPAEPAAARPSAPETAKSPKLPGLPTAQAAKPPPGEEVVGRNRFGRQIRVADRTAGRGLGRWMVRSFGAGAATAISTYAIYSELQDLFGEYHNGKISREEFKTEFIDTITRNVGGTAGAAIGAIVGGVGGRLITRNPLAGRALAVAGSYVGDEVGEWLGGQVSGSTMAHRLLDPAANWAASTQEDADGKPVAATAEAPAGGAPPASVSPPSASPTQSSPTNSPPAFPPAPRPEPGSAAEVQQILNGGVAPQASNQSSTEPVRVAQADTGVMNDAVPAWSPELEATARASGAAAAQGLPASNVAAASPGREGAQPAPVGVVSTSNSASAPMHQSDASELPVSTTTAASLPSGGEQQTVLADVYSLPIELGQPGKKPDASPQGDANKPASPEKDEASLLTQATSLSGEVLNSIRAGRNPSAAETMAVPTAGAPGTQVNAVAAVNNPSDMPQASGTAEDIYNAAAGGKPSTPFAKLPAAVRQQMQAGAGHAQAVREEMAGARQKAAEKGEDRDNWGRLRTQQEDVKPIVLARPQGPMPDPYQAPPQVRSDVAAMMDGIDRANPNQPSPVPQIGDPIGAGSRIPALATPDANGAPGQTRPVQSGPGDRTPIRGNSFDEKSPAIMQRLQNDFGFTREQAAGVMGNLGHESGGFKQMQEVRPVNGGRGGLGWPQWTGPRRSQFEAWAAERKLSTSSDEANYGFLHHELQTTYKSTVDKVRNSQTSQQATRAFQEGFERADPRYVNYASRDRYAQRALTAANQQPAPQQVADASPQPDQPEQAGPGDQSGRVNQPRPASQPGPEPQPNRVEQPRPASQPGPVADPARVEQPRQAGQTVQADSQAADQLRQKYLNRRGAVRAEGGQAQCVDLARDSAGLGHTGEWRAGDKASGQLAAGTSIATFDRNGRYGNHTDGSSHTAVVLGPAPGGGVRIMEQWAGHAPRERVLNANGRGGMNDLSAYSVVEGTHGSQTARARQTQQAQQSQLPAQSPQPSTQVAAAADPQAGVGVRGSSAATAARGAPVDSSGDGGDDGAGAGEVVAAATPDTAGYSGGPAQSPRTPPALQGVNPTPFRMDGFGGIPGLSSMTGVSALRTAATNPIQGLASTIQAPINGVLGQAQSASSNPFRPAPARAATPEAPAGVAQVQQNRDLAAHESAQASGGGSAGGMGGGMSAMPAMAMPAMASGGGGGGGAPSGGGINNAPKSSEQLSPLILALNAGMFS